MEGGGVPRGAGPRSFKLKVLDRELAGVNPAPMWFLKRKTRARRDRDIADRLGELDRQLAELAKLSAAHDEQLQELRHLPMEWEDWFEKFKNLYARLNKRTQREEAATSEPAALPMSPAAARLLGIRG